MIHHTRDPKFRQIANSVPPTPASDWLGAALGTAFAVLAGSFKNGWIHFGSSIVTGMGFILALVVLSAAGLAYWRRGSSSPVEIGFYWLGSVRLA